MKTSIILLLTILGLTFSSIASTKMMPSGSFLNEPVQTTKQLVSQLQTDVVVARRYKQQFGVPDNKIIDYFKGNLRASTLKKAGKYNVYYYSRKITKRVERLIKGTRVFVNLQGKPVLKMRCGNPLVSQLRQVPKQPAKPPVKKVTTNISKPVVPTPVVPTLVDEVPLTTAIQTVEVIEAEIPPLIPPGVTEIIPIEETLPGLVPVQEVPVAAIPAAVTSSTSSEWFLAPIGIGFVLFLSNQGGGNEQPPTVPEPSSMMALATGICSMALIMCRRRK